jgi:hypothetical protein
MSVKQTSKGSDEVKMKLKSENHYLNLMILNGNFSLCPPIWMKVFLLLPDRNTYWQTICF